MKPWCDRPLCTRSYSHGHVDRPEGVAGDDLSDVGAVPSPVEAGNGSEAPVRSLGDPTEDLLRVQAKAVASLVGTSAPPEPEDKGGASPEVEAGDGGEDSPWVSRWEVASSAVAHAEDRLGAARARRLELLTEMRATMSLGKIAEVTGLSRQRVGQILGAK